MAATYTSPSNSARDLLRFEVGDTDTASPLLQDAEYDYLITTYSDQNRRVGYALLYIGRKLLRYPNFALDKWREDRHTMAQSMIKEGKELISKASSQGLYAGGISKADKDTREEDTDRDAPFAYLNMDEDPEASAVTEKDTESDD